MRVISANYGNVDLGSLNYTYDSVGERFYVPNFDVVLPNLKHQDSVYDIPNFYCSTLTPCSIFSFDNDRVDMAIRGHISLNGYIFIRYTKCKSVSQLKQALSGIILTYELATPKTTQPYGYLPTHKARVITENGYIQVNKGKVKVSNVCQLANKEIYYSTRTINGITFTNNNDGTITCNGSSTSITQLYLDNDTGYQILGHKYLLIGCPQGGSRTTYYLDSCSGADTGSGSIKLNDYRYSLRIYILGGVTLTNITFKPQMFDLTEMYGAGNEPTSVAQFKQDFPLDYYDYAPKCYIPFK